MHRRNAFTRSLPGLIGLVVLAVMVGACLLSLPYTLGASPSGPPRYAEQVAPARQLPPWWLGSWGLPSDPIKRAEVQSRIDATRALTGSTPRYWMGSDLLGRSLLIRVLAGGGISLTIGLAAAALSVFLGTTYGALAGYVGGRTDAVMMRIVDILYGLPYILLVVLLAVAVSASVEKWQMRRAEAATAARERFVADNLAIPLMFLADFQGTYGRTRAQGYTIQRDPLTLLRVVEAEFDELEPEEQTTEWKAARDGLAAKKAALQPQAMAAIGSGELSPATTQLIGICTLFIAIGGVSWLTMARVVRGQVLSLKSQPFMEAARAMGTPVTRQFTRHLLPNLIGPITVYTTLTVPQAILQESFLSFLGIGVRPPLPSWGNLAADGLTELNPYESRWWLLFFPCAMLGLTLLALNFVGEGLREALDPKGRRR